jgi:glucose-1-phosphate thymidylyltransferase
MKALILAGGKGSRLRPITHSIAKQLVPVANKPVIEYGIEAIREAGVRDFGIIVGDSAEEIKAALGDGARWDASFTLIPQDAPLGLAHAVKTARPYLQNDAFIMYLGDNLIKGGVRELVSEFSDKSIDASILLTQVPNPSEFGVAELDGSRVIRLEEKPKSPKSDYALVGVYLFRSSVFDAISTLKPSFRGEYEITDAIQALIDGGKHVRSHIVTGWWKDTGTVEAMLDANRLILESMQHTVNGTVLNSSVTGELTVGSATVVNGCKLAGPAIIGENCLVENCEIGPFTSIAAGTVLRSTKIENSIVMEDCVIEGVRVGIRNSLIGRGVRVKQDGMGGVVLVLGDNSAIAL